MKNKNVLMECVEFNTIVGAGKFIIGVPLSTDKYRFLDLETYFASLTELGEVLYL